MLKKNSDIDTKRWQECEKKGRFKNVELKELQQGGAV